MSEKYNWIALLVLDQTQFMAVYSDRRTIQSGGEQLLGNQLSTKDC